MPSSTSSGAARLIKVKDEDHTLGTTLVSALWAQPHVIVAQYAQKHVVNREEISVHVQTDGQLSATASLVDALKLMKTMMTGMEDKMKAALETWDSLPQQEKDDRNRNGMNDLEMQFAAAEEELRESRVNDDDEDEALDDNPFRRILLEAQRRRNKY